MANSKPNDMLSAREENRLIKAGQRFLLEGGYPNPDRVGCPGVEALKALAQRKADLRQSEQAVLHIGELFALLHRIHDITEAGHEAQGS